MVEHCALNAIKKLTLFLKISVMRQSDLMGNQPWEGNPKRFPPFERRSNKWALADILWQKGLDSVPQNARQSGIFKEVDIPQNTGNSRQFSEIDTQEYADKKAEGDQANRASVQQGLMCVALVKSLLNNGKALTIRLRVTRGKLGNSLLQPQRLSGETMLVA